MTRSDKGNERHVILSYNTNEQVWQGNLNLPISIYGHDCIRVAVLSWSSSPFRNDSYTGSFVMDLIEPECIDHSATMLVMNHTIKSAQRRKLLRGNSFHLLRWLTLKRRHKDITSITVTIKCLNEKVCTPYPQIGVLLLLFDTDGA